MADVDHRRDFCAACRMYGIPWAPCPDCGAAQGNREHGSPFPRDERPS